MFSPTCSLVRQAFAKEAPQWLTVKSGMKDTWGACVQILRGHLWRVKSVDFSHDSSKFATASLDGTVILWDTSNGHPLHTLHTRHMCEDDAYFAGRIVHVIFSHDSKKLASSFSGAMKIWDTSKGQCLQTLTGHRTEVTCMSFSHDSSRLASASRDKTVKIWNTNSGDCLRTLEDHDTRVTSVLISSNHPHATADLASVSEDGLVKLWNTEGDCLQTTFTEKASKFTFLNDSSFLATVTMTDDQIITIWDTLSGKPLRRLKGHQSSIESLAVSRDTCSPTHLASSSNDGTIKIWNPANGQCVRTLVGEPGYPPIAISHDLTRIVSGSTVNFAVLVWDTKLNESPQAKLFNWRKLGTIVLSKDGRLLATVSNEMDAGCLVQIWDTNSLDCLHTFMLENNWYKSDMRNSGAFSCDSTLLALVASEFSRSVVTIWDIDKETCVKELPIEIPFQSIKFSPRTNAQFAFASDGSIYLWNTISGHCEKEIKMKDDCCDFEYDDTGRYLHICGEVIDLCPTMPSFVEIQAIFPNCQRVTKGLGAFPNGAWITWNDHQLLWVPRQYRSGLFKASGLTFAMRLRTKEMFICTFSPEVSTLV